MTLAFKDRQIQIKNYLFLFRPLAGITFKTVLLAERGCVKCCDLPLEKLVWGL